MAGAVSLYSLARGSTELNASNAVLGAWKAVLTPVVHSDMSAVRTDYS